MGPLWEPPRPLPELHLVQVPQLVRVFMRYILYLCYEMTYLLSVARGAFTILLRRSGTTRKWGQAPPNECPDRT